MTSAPVVIPAPSAGKVTAEQIVDGDCPAELIHKCKTLAVRYERLASYEQMADIYRAEVRSMLVDIGAACADDDAFEALRAKYFPNIRRSRSYELRAIAAGTKTVEQVREQTRNRVARHRSAKRAASVTRPVTDDGENCETSAEDRKKHYARTEPVEDVITAWLRESDPKVIAAAIRNALSPAKVAIIRDTLTKNFPRLELVPNQHTSSPP